MVGFIERAVQITVELDNEAVRLQKGTGKIVPIVWAFRRFRQG